MKSRTSARDKIVTLLNAQKFAAVRIFGAKGLKILKELIAADDTLLAGKAIRAASHYRAKQAETILMAAAKSRERLLRVSADTAAADLGREGASVLQDLLRSKDASIQKWTQRGMDKLKGPQ